MVSCERAPGGRDWLWATSAVGRACQWRPASGSTTTGRSRRRFWLRPEAITHLMTSASRHFEFLDRVEVDFDEARVEHVFRFVSHHSLLR